MKQVKRVLVVTLIAVVVLVMVVPMVAKLGYAATSQQQLTEAHEKILQAEKKPYDPYYGPKKIPEEGIGLQPIGKP